MSKERKADGGKEKTSDPGFDENSGKSQKLIDHPGGPGPG
jgi:hypothetical protein